MAGSKHGVKGFVEHDNGYRGIPYHHINLDLELNKHSKKLIGPSKIDIELAAYYHPKPRGRKYNDVYYHFMGGY